MSTKEMKRQSIGHGRDNITKVNVEEEIDEKNDVEETKQQRKEKTSNIVLS